MFEEYLNSGREIRVVYRCSENLAQTEVAYGELIEITASFLKLRDQRTNDIRYVAIREIVQISPRVRRYGI